MYQNQVTIINSDHCLAISMAFSKGNSKSWVKSSFEKTSKPPATKSRNVSTKSSSKISASSHSTQRIEQTDSHILWAEKYAPQNICDLAVHKKKISDIEEWVLSTNSNNKESVYNSYFKKEIEKRKADFTHLRKDVSKQESQVTLFRSFLLRANKYPNLDKKCDSCKKVILIKDFPNVFYVDQTEFRHLLRIYKQTARSPIVFIITDNNDSEDNVRLLFPKDIQVALNMHSISFNPVSNTLMLKALKLAVKVAEKQVPESGGRVERHRIQVLETSVKFPQSAMIWGAMSSAGVGPSYFIMSKVNAAFYQELLNHFMLPPADKLYGDADFLLQQDLAPAHSIKTTSNWFVDHSITLLDWPANLPCWGIVKRKIRDTRPNNTDELKLTVTPMLQTTLDKLVATSGGDIRSAVNSLQFSCSRAANGKNSRNSGIFPTYTTSQRKSTWLGNRLDSLDLQCAVNGKLGNGVDAEFVTCPDVSAKNLPAKSRKKRKKNDFVGNTDTELSFCGRDASLSLFRIIGKVLYCKRTDDIEKPEMDLPNNLLHMSRKSLTFCPEKILEQMPVSAECLNLFLHQNYLQFIGEMDGLIKSSEYFSDADFLMSNWASKNIMEQYSTCIASRGIMFSNQSVQSTGWRPLHKPEWFNIMRDRRNNEIDAKYRTCEFIRSDTNLFTEYIPFMKYLSVTKSHVQGHDSIIKSLSVMCNKQNSHNRFKRKELLSEQDVVVMDETVNDDIQHKNSDLILNADLDDPSEFLIEDFSD
ncbi:Cell cycle checkpoint protein RAD17 [Nymphon striatum]|nr:Cell cycle checkpoint protein RAD17 [Nymphon striatum]